ncbi:MAG: hypothetical protein ABIO91_02965 [Pyrinomonadaceae bacterium]
MDTNLKTPTDEELRLLYALAAELKELAPWGWMKEDDIFGVQDPETKEVGFVSVMGRLAEHTAVAVYIGAKGLYELLDLQDGALEIDPFALVEIQQLQLSFESREILEKRDRDEIKRLGLKFRGAGNYPLFRSMGSGFLPWFITSDEARFLIHVLEQALEIAARFEQDPDIFTVADDPDGDMYLLRVSEIEEDDLEWRDEMKKIREPEPERVSFNLSDAMLHRLKKYPQDNKLIFEVDLFRAPTPLLNSEQRPFVPKMLIMAERNSRFVLGAEFLEPTETTAQLAEAAAASLFKIWESHKVIPKEILVGSDVVYGVLRGFTQKLNATLRQTDDLIAIDEACEDMFKAF